LSIYGSNPVNLTLPVGGAKQLAFPGNPNRVCLIIAALTNAQIGVAYTNQAGLLGNYWSLFGSRADPMTYQKFGPLIQYEVWLSSLGVNAVTCFATEIYKLPGC